jgi:hypothetical protein
MSSGVVSTLGTANVPSSIVNSFSTAGVTPVASANTASSVCKTALSGACTANTLKTALSISGRGRLNAVALYTNDTTSRTLRIRITLDGVVAFDPGASGATTTSGAGIVAVGQFNGSTVAYQPVNFNASCLVEIATSVTETDKMTAAYAYEVFQ